jgi:hypothetical protein
VQKVLARSDANGYRNPPCRILLLLRRRWNNALGTHILTIDAAMVSMSRCRWVWDFR